jgi:hypothetical protein
MTATPHTQVSTYIVHPPVLWTVDPNDFFSDQGPALSLISDPDLDPDTDLDPAIFSKRHIRAY